MGLRLQRFADVAVCTVVLATVVDWALDLLLPAAANPEGTAMAANTVIALLLLSEAVLLRGTRHRRLRTGFAAGAALIGAITLLDHVVVGQDRDIALTGVGSLIDPARVSLGTAVVLALVGVAIVLSDHGSRRMQVFAQLLVLGAGGIGLVALVGYASGLRALYWQTDYASMRFQAATAAVLIVVAVLAGAPRVGIVGSIARKTPGGALLRWLVPAVVLVPISVIIPVGRVELAGGLGGGVELLIVAGVTIAAFVPILFVTARALDRLDAFAAGVSAEREQLLAESHAVLNATTEGILLTDPDGVVLLTNAAMRVFWEQLGLPATGTIWERLARLSSLTDDPERYVRDFAGLVRDPGREYVSEFTLRESDRSFLGRTAVVPSPGGNIIGRIFTLRETTAERSGERMKDEFLATVSHELRTPLAAITGYLELFVDEHGSSLQGTGAEFLRVVERNVQRLSRLVDDLLLVQQVRIEGVTIDAAEVNLTKLIEHCLENARPAAARRDVSLSLEGDREIVAEADPLRLGQVIDNLLSNAVKFTPPGGAVTVRLARSGAGSWYTIDVSDTGPGIPADERDRLFRRFYRSREAIAQAVPGTGLGLVVSRHLTEAHGGTLDLVDVPGSGTTFRITLPLRAHEARGRAA